jgi:hypothetical protein
MGRVVATATGQAIRCTGAPGPLGYLLVVVVGAAGAIITAPWWRDADQSR